MNRNKNDGRTFYTISLSQWSPAGAMFLDYKKNRPWVENLTITMQLGLTMVGCILFCFFIGRYLDKWLGTPGIFVIIFTILGIVGGAVTVYRQIMEKTEEDRKDKRYPTDGEG